MPFIYLNYIYSTIFNILLIFISIYNAPYHRDPFYDGRFPGLPVCRLSLDYVGR